MSPPADLPWRVTADGVVFRFATANAAINRYRAARETAQRVRLEMYRADVDGWETVDYFERADK